MGVCENVWVVRMTVQHRLTGEQVEIMDPLQYYVTLGGSVLPRSEWILLPSPPITDYRWAEIRRVDEGMPE